jgi:general secretion pathway protein G
MSAGFNSRWSASGSATTTSCRRPSPGSDPWGRPYQYLNIALAPNPGVLRKDKNLVPINTDYDLYSLGRDGDSVPPLNAAKSRDDIVRANNGAFIGKGEDY